MPTNTLGLAIVLFPVLAMLFFIAVWSILRRKYMASSLSYQRKSKGPIWTIYTFLIGLALTIILNQFITLVLKRQIGRLRPDFLVLQTNYI